MLDIELKKKISEMSMEDLIELQTEAQLARTSKQKDTVFDVQKELNDFLKNARKKDVYIRDEIGGHVIYEFTMHFNRETEKYYLIPQCRYY